VSTPPLPRSQFAVTEKYAYLNHAAVGVLPRLSCEALQAFIAEHGRAGVLGVAPYEKRMPEFRAAIGAFIGASGSEIAILRNTGDGANALAGGVRWNDGDEIILPDNEFPANVLPWLAMRDRGVNVRLIPAKQERMTPDVLRRHISKRTRVVTVSWVGYDDGYRYDLAGLGEVAHAAGALLCVDAIQGLGAFPLDVRACGVDALYCGGAKWMLAVQGVSFLYLRAELLNELRIVAPGWRTPSDIWNFEDYEQPPIANASRFEGGTPNFIGALSFERAIALFQQNDPDAIARHILVLTDQLCEGLQRAGAEIASPRGPETSSGVVTFTLPGCDSVMLGRAMQRENVITTWRSNGIRVAPHGYNDAEDINRLLDALKRSIVKGTP
jgi:selenocysteine lyase/cysteine desulfurase